MRLLCRGDLRHLGFVEFWIAAPAQLDSVPERVRRMFAQLAPQTDLPLRLIESHIKTSHEKEYQPSMFERRRATPLPRPLGRLPGRAFLLSAQMRPPRGNGLAR